MANGNSINSMENDDDEIVFVRWGEISSYLGVSNKTAVRYAQDKGLTVHRDPAGHPWITKAEIDAWRRRGA